MTGMIVIAHAGRGSLPFQKREGHCMVQERGDPCDCLCPPQQPPNHELNEEDCPKPSSGMPETLHDGNVSVMSYVIIHECLSYTVPECWMLHALIY